MIHQVWKPVEGEERPAHLKSLNDFQLKAVVADPKTPLQILAGPGSGKTRVLTSRIAHLVSHHKVPAAQIVAVTFTNKAAREMEHRLRNMLGEEGTKKLILGTFHHTCLLYLRRHGRLLNLPNNFTITDADATKKTIKAILQNHTDITEQIGKVKEATAMDYISRAKAKGETPATKKKAAEKEAGNDLQGLLATVYGEYEDKLRENDSLDFDDLLAWALKLFKENPELLVKIKHIFVDEFQDTNTVQYELMKLFARASKCVTIVGDPDQSIYAWRSAETANIDHMQKDFPGTEQIFLEENYRSTGHILAASHAVISQDTERIAKSLHTSHVLGEPVVIKLFATAASEAEFVATEVKRIKHCTGLEWSDFAILSRINQYSLAFEQAFTKASIPTKMVGGHKFFSRIEVQMVMAYLQLADNAAYTPAYNRVINIPKRGMGEKTLEKIAAAASKKKLKPLVWLMTPDGRSAHKTTVAFSQAIEELQKMSTEGATVKELIDRLLSRIDLRGHLQLAEDNFEQRWGNVEELMSHAVRIEAERQVKLTEKPPRAPATGDADAPIDLSDEEEEPVQSSLQFFLQSCMLSTDTEAEEEGKTTPKVTLCTVHAAKGLEWPVVFIPAAEEGAFPMLRAGQDGPNEIAEERRLLYVAMTRAQGFLYVTHTRQRMVAGMTMDRKPSPFIHGLTKGGAIPSVSSELPTISPSVRASLSVLTGRPRVPEGDIQAAIKLNKVTQSPPRLRELPPASSSGSWARRRYGSPSGKRNYWTDSDGRDEFALPSMNADDLGEGSSRQPFPERESKRAEIPAGANEGFVMASSLTAGGAGLGAKVGAGLGRARSTAGSSSSSSSLSPSGGGLGKGKRRVATMAGVEEHDGEAKVEKKTYASVPSFRSAASASLSSAEHLSSLGRASSSSSNPSASSSSTTSTAPPASHPKPFKRPRPAASASTVLRPAAFKPPRPSASAASSSHSHSISYRLPSSSSSSASSSAAAKIDRYTLPPLDPHTTKGAHPSVLAQPTGPKTSLSTFTNAASSDLDLFKSLGLPDAGGSEKKRSRLG